MRLSSLFFIYIIAEIICFVIAGKVLGVGLTLLIILVTGILGIVILRFAGFSTLLTMRQKMAQGQAPEADIYNGLLLGLGGIFLIAPGLLGDVFGLLLVFPLTRKLFKKFVGQFLLKSSIFRQQGFTYEHFYQSDKVNSNPDIIEGEWREKDK